MARRSAWDREQGRDLGFSSGTAALHLLGVATGDEVLVSSLTFAATANAVRYGRGRDEEVT